MPDVGNKESSAINKDGTAAIIITGKMAIKPSRIDTSKRA
jgi:hypothetical protein